MDVNPSEIPENLRFSQVAVVQIDKSEEVCIYLRQRGIESYVKGSLAYALHVEDDRSFKVHGKL